MRIIGGQYKGFRFEPPSKIPARPTTDRAKESLINILLSQNSVVDKTCLDLFSGTGNMSYELASQGAASVTAIDLNFHATDYIRQTFQNLGYEPFRVIRSDVYKWLKQYSGPGFELIFADPPYEHPGIAQLPDLIFNQGVIVENGVLIIEHRSSLNFRHARFKDQRDYGQSRFSFFG